MRDLQPAMAEIGHLQEFFVGRQQRGAGEVGLPPALADRFPAPVQQFEIEVDRLGVDGLLRPQVVAERVPARVRLDDQRPQQGGQHGHHDQREDVAEEAEIEPIGGREEPHVHADHQQQQRDPVDREGQDAAAPGGADLAGRRRQAGDLARTSRSGVQGAGHRVTPFSRCRRLIAVVFSRVAASRVSRAARRFSPR